MIPEMFNIMVLSFRGCTKNQVVRMTFTEERGSKSPENRIEVCLYYQHGELAYLITGLL